MSSGDPRIALLALIDDVLARAEVARVSRTRSMRRAGGGRSVTTWRLTTWPAWSLGGQSAFASAAQAPPDEVATHGRRRSLMSLGKLIDWASLEAKLDDGTGRVAGWITAIASLVWDAGSGHCDDSRGV